MPEPNQPNQPSQPAQPVQPQAPAGGGAQITIQEFSRVELRVGQVKEVTPHPRADKLLVLKVDLGDPEPRQLVAGIKGYYEPSALVGKQVVVVANLAPAVLRGERSEGMVLAAVVGNEPVLLTADKTVPSGAKVR
jgi:methionyl-tRNA synthetase